MAKVQLDAILKLVDVQINPQVFRKISQAVAGLPPSLQKTDTHLKSANKSAQGLNRSLNKTKQQLNGNERASRLFLQRMAQFAILLPTFATLNRALQGSVKFLFEFDSALRDIVRIDVGGLKDRMEEIGDAALKTAVDFGVTGTEVLGVTRVFKQAGDSIEDSQARARTAILATQISTLSSAQATEVFIASARQFGKVGKDSAAVLDKLAKVEDIAAVNAGDVADAFRTGGNALAEFTGSIDDSIGLIAALRDQTRKSGREIGTFFKTLQTRVFAVGDARSAVEGLGVSVENLDGSLRPTMAVLNDLKTAFDGLTQAQRTNAAKSIAGIRQFEGLIATLNSLEKANEFAAESAQAAGTAEEKRAITDAKLERQLGKLVAQGQLLAEAMGDAGLEDALSNVLSIATGILKVFTSMVGVTGDIGGNITPLLALGGVALGRGVFGLGGKGGAGVGKGGPAKMGAPTSGMIGPQPLSESQKQIVGFGTQVGRAKNAVIAQGLAIKASVTKRMALSRGEEAAFKTSQRAFLDHTRAVRSNMSAIKTSSVAKTKQGGGLGGALDSGLGTALLSLIGTQLPALFGGMSEGLRESNNNLAGFSADLLDASSSGLSMGAQFLILGKKAGAAGLMIGSLTAAYAKLKPLIEDEFNARDELSKQAAGQAAETGLRAKFSGDTDASKKAAEQVVESFAVAFGAIDDMGKAQASAFTDLAGKLNVDEAVLKDTLLTKSANAVEQVELSLGGVAGAAKDAATDIGNIGNPLLIASDLFGKLGISRMRDNNQIIAMQANQDAAIRDVIRNSADYILQLADEGDVREEATDLIEQSNAGALNAAQAFSKLTAVLAASGRAVNEATGKFEAVAISFSEIVKLNQTKALADEIRTLGLEMELAKLGPDAMADSLVRLQQEFLLTEREASNNITRLNQEFGVLLGELPGFAQKSSMEVFKAINDGISVDPSKVKELEDMIFNRGDKDTGEGFSKLSSEQNTAVKAMLKNLRSRLQEEQKILEADNAVKGEISSRSRDMLQSETQAAQNAFESTRRFTAELQKFGDVVNTDVLSGFQDIGLGDIDEVLGGTSGLGEGMQQLILSAFADPIAKAELALKAATEGTQAELDILASRLDNVNQKLSDQANHSEFAALTASKLALELEMENAVQNGAVESTKLKIKVLEAEREAEEDAAEAAAKRAELLEKLADASRSFDKELKDVERSFEDFQKQKIADLLSQETDARSELKDAQQEVLSTTQALAEAYDSLLKAQLEFNGAIAEAKVKSGLLARDIGMLTGSISTFSGSLSSLSGAFDSALNDANITLEKRISLERQLAEETLSFLQQAQSEIVQAGLGIFGQTGGENQALGEGIQGLQFIADQLGGSFESFLNLTQGELSSVSETLLGLPVEFRQTILDALSFLPSTADIGGFSVEQLTQAIGQIGAGVDPEAGLPSIEELNGQQVEQLTKLQELALQDAQLQFAQVIAAQEQVAAAEEAAEAAKLLEERASENLEAVRDAVLEEKAVLDLANDERRELMAAVVAADDKNTLMQIEKEAQLFAEQNAAFREVGDIIVQGISSAIGGRLAVIEAAAAVGSAARGHIPNFAGGNLTPKEAAGLLRAGAREKRAMPGGAGLAVANTSEAIIPMSRGFIPNFAEGNSDISAGISAIKGINETVVAAIARSVTAALTDLGTGGGATEELLGEVISQLSSLNSVNEDISASNSTVASNTSDTAAGGTTTATAAGTEKVEITLQTNQNNTVSITGLESLRSELEVAVADATASQVDEQTTALFEQLQEIITALQERGILSSFGQTR